MGKNSDPTRGCTGKRRFDSFGKAKRAAARASFKREDRFDPYHCRRCNGFHYGAHVHRERRPRLIELVLLTTEGETE